MLIINYTNKNRYVHHIGYKVEDFQIEYISSIQADGDELNEIYDTCPIALNNNSSRLSQIFYGDIAKTIVANLPRNK